jgi:hypothetical protein
MEADFWVIVRTAWDFVLLAERVGAVSVRSQRVWPLLGDGEVLCQGLVQP